MDCMEMDYIQYYFNYIAFHLKISECQRDMCIIIWAS
jgi:hypothetical protein